ncbi:MAG: hypothetical protein R3B12_01295 [Candidatus Saccharimonadales bacterium]
MALNSQAKSADGASIAANAIYLQTADGTNPVSLARFAQTFAGAKTLAHLSLERVGLTTWRRHILKRQQVTLIRPLTLVPALAPLL